jgi:hypothetical protein
MPTKKTHVVSHHQARSSSDVLTVLEWIAPGRPFKKRSKQYYLTALLIMLLVEIILFLFSQYLLMFVIVSLVFVAFALASVPPRDFTYRISSEGVQIEDRFFLWQELYDFYFYKRDGVETLHIRTKDFLLGELIITLGDNSQDSIKKALIPFLPFREYVRPTFMDKAAAWLSKNFPLESK